MEKSYMETPIPIYFTMYFFNVTNPDEYLDGEEKPKLQEMGPYVYLQKRYKHNLSYDHETGTVKYYEQKIYFFDKEKSAGSEDDIITTLNPVYVTMAAKGETQSETLASIMSLWAWQFDLFPFVSKSVRELAFEGYEDPIIYELYELSGKEKYASNRTGYLYGKNETWDNVREVYTGENGDGLAHHVYKFHNKNHTEAYKGEECNALKGTFGSIFPRPVDRNEFLYMQSSDLCRPVTISFEKEVPLGPLNLLRYVLDESVLEVSDKNRECYYWNDFFARRAMYDVSRCRDGAPLVMSTPHFYSGDKRDQEAVEGLSPNKEKHELFVDIEQNTGLLMRGAKRLQVNFAIRKYTKMFSDLEDAAELIFPVLWVEEGVTAPDARVEGLYLSLTKPKEMVGYISIGLVVLGVVFVLSAVILVCVSQKKQKKNKLAKGMDPKSQVALIEKNGTYQPTGYTPAS